MAGSATAIVLTAAEYRRLTGWVRAGTTPQRLVRRARVVLGSASGLGSRALARRERMSRTTVPPLAGTVCRQALRRATGSPSQWSTTGPETQDARTGRSAGVLQAR
jgi:hypothetical protein